MAAFCFLLSPHYDTLLRAIDGGLFYFLVSYLMKAVHSFTSRGVGVGTTGRRSNGQRKMSFSLYFLEEDKDWSWSSWRGVKEVRAEL